MSGQSDTSHRDSEARAHEAMTPPTERGAVEEAARKSFLMGSGTRRVGGRSILRVAGVVVMGSAAASIIGLFDHSEFGLPATGVGLLAWLLVHVCVAGLSFAIIYRDLGRECPPLERVVTAVMASVLAFAVYLLLATGGCMTLVMLTEGA